MSAQPDVFMDGQDHLVLLGRTAQQLPNETLSPQTLESISDLLVDGGNLLLIALLAEMDKTIPAAQLAALTVHSANRHGLLVILGGASRKSQEPTRQFISDQSWIGVQEALCPRSQLDKAGNEQLLSTASERVFQMGYIIRNEAQLRTAQQLLLRLSGNNAQSLRSSVWRSELTASLSPSDRLAEASDLRSI